jgi:hypothetical protein
MRRLIIVCTVVGLVLVSNSATNAVAVESGGWASLDYSIALPAGASEYQHTHAEAGFDIATGTPVSTDDDYTQPYSYAYASISHSWGESEADTSQDYLGAANYASADGSVLESWGYGSTIYRLSFTLGTQETIDIGYTFSGNIWVDSSSTYGSAFSVGLCSIEIDDIQVYDSDPDWDDYVEVIGVGSASKDLSDSGTIPHVFEPGSHEIVIILDTYENAAVPEPTTICLLGLGGLSLLRRKR